ncbi:MAG: hypothetical protein IKX28_08445 [Bacteroidales bacterium]|nr:hypothetical protein [Bacteroidales bacterium]
MKTKVLILLLFSGLLMVACGMTWEGDPEDPEVMELRSKTPIPLMSLAGTTWVKGDVMRSVKLDERGIIIPGETALVLCSPALPYGPYIDAWSFEEESMIAYVCFRFPEAGTMKKMFWFKRVIDPSTGKAFSYSVDREHKTVTAPAFGLGPAPFDIYIFNPEEMVLLSAVPNGYYALSLRPAKYQEQEALSAAKGPGEAGFDESYAAVLAALEQDCKDLGMSEVETAAIRTSFVNSLKSVFGGESAAN